MTQNKIIVRFQKHFFEKVQWRLLVVNRFSKVECWWPLGNIYTVVWIFLP